MEKCGGIDRFRNSAEVGGVAHEAVAIIRVNNSPTAARNPEITAEAGSAQSPRSTRRDTALHRAVKAALQVADFRSAVEGREGGFQQLGAESGGADRLHRRSSGFVPGEIETV